jgi:hypothetical protein
MAMTMEDPRENRCLDRNIRYGHAVRNHKKTDVYWMTDRPREMRTEENLKEDLKEDDRCNLSLHSLS